MPDKFTDLQTAIAALAEQRPDIWTLSACGVTRSERQIPALIDRDAYGDDSPRARVLLVGGLSGKAEDVDIAMRTLSMFAGGGDALSSVVSLSAVPCGNPDGLAQGLSPGNGAKGNPSAGYPPEGRYYFDPYDPESRYLWRWACFLAPNLTLEVQHGDTTKWEANAAASGIRGIVDAVDAGPADSLVAALGQGTPNGLGTIPALRLTCAPDALEAEISKLYNAVMKGGPGLGTSLARDALQRRTSRSPVEVARVLAGTYGHVLEPVIYTQGVGVSGRLRLAALDPESSNHVQGVAELVEPYVTGKKLIWGPDAGGSHLAGVVWAEDMADATGEKEYEDILTNAADHYRDTGPGAAPPPADPDFRTEDMFYCAAILGRAYRLTGEDRYVNMLARFIVDGNIQQENGLFWHCRSAPHFWGRGNGFALLGLTETLTYLPENHSRRGTVLGMYRRHVDGMLRHQQPSGMFLQVVDFPGSYQEHTCTCMVGIAMARGIMRGWLDASYEPALLRIWRAISERVDDSGNVVDGCTGTGVQENLRAYLDREALFGYDDRTGSMAIWFATEMARYWQDG
jgi:rhamnogalacturonyl hydrolase YesR